MSKWIYNKTKNNTIKITRHTEDAAPIIIGETEPNLTNALIEIAQEFEPGDLVITPEGTSLVYDRQGWLEN